MGSPTRFVRHRKFGIGWHDSTRDVVVFFDSPPSLPIEVSAEDQDFTPCVLESQERVWWFDGGRWLVGRINESGVDPDRYLVEFPNGRSEWIAAEELRVRWNRPIGSPLELLKCKAAETRFFHRVRSNFLRNVTSQRAASQALGGVISSGVELHAHQVAAVRRVVQDPVRRYLLADEVGLGKTIEAGMVARQLLIERPGGVLVVAPGSLTGQWGRELEQKFRVDSLGGYAEVVSYSDLDEVTSEPRRLLIVDEAHRLAGGSTEVVGETYRQILQIGRASDALLLLSATPVRSNEDGFLRLLHLLDPDAYPLDNVERFRDRVRMRDDLASLMAELNPDLPIAFLDEAVQRAVDLVADDTTVAALGGTFARAFAEGDEVAGTTAVRRLRSHLAETYRIHRRMIRTRRTKALMETFPVRGRQTAADWLIVDHDERRRQLPALLDEIRFRLQSIDPSTAREVLRALLGRTGGPIEYLIEFGQAIAGIGSVTLEPEEVQSLNDLVGSDLGISVGGLLMGLESAPTESNRFDAVVGWALSKVGRSQVAVASSSTSMATRVADTLRDRLGDHRVAEVTNRLSELSREEEGRKFFESPDNQCTVLVIDRSAEEGLNLQRAEQLLHVDLVVSASRIEQRLGRFDRWSNKLFEPVESFAFREVDDALDTELGAWRQVLHEAFGIFDRSTATLQYVLPSFEDQFLDQVLDHGLSAAAADLKTLSVEVEQQRRLITNHDMLDSLEDGSDDDELIDAIGALDSLPDEIRTSVKEYAVDALRLNIKGVGSPSGGKLLPLVPRSLANHIVGSSLAGVAQQKGYTSRRTEAVRSGTRLLRYGEPLVDRLLEFAIRDDRGRAFIAETPVPGAPAELMPMFLYLFDFKIEPSQEALAKLPPQARPGALSLAQRFAPARFERVLALDGHDGAVEQQLRAFLELPSINLASRPDRLDELLLTADWPAMCDRRYEAASAAIQKRLDQRDEIGHALRRFDRFDALEEAVRERRNSLGYEDSTTSAEFKHIVRSAIAAAEIGLDSCGVLILTDEPRR